MPREDSCVHSWEQQAGRRHLPSFSGSGSRALTRLVLWHDFGLFWLPSLLAVGSLNLAEALRAHTYTCCPGTQSQALLPTPAVIWGPVGAFGPMDGSRRGDPHCFLLALPDGSVSQGRHNKLPETGATTIEMYFLTVLEDRGLTSRCQQGWFLLEVLRETPSQASFLASGGSRNPRPSLACTCIFPASTSVFMWLTPVSLGLNSSSFLL